MALAKLQLRIPEPFDFKELHNWFKWKKHFEQFWVASGLSKENKSSQVNNLLYSLRKEAVDVLASTNITEDEYMTKSDQLKRESIEQYITVRTLV